MNWSMKEVLFILSSFCFLNCSSLDEDGQKAVSELTDPIATVDSYLFVLSNILENGLYRNEALSADTLTSSSELTILGMNNKIEPGHVLFSGTKTQLEGITNDLNNLSDAQYYSDENFEVWLIHLAGKRVLEFSRFQHPGIGDIIVARQKIQE